MVSDILLGILSRLTVYQSLQESSSVVLAVRDDVPMADACCLFLPSATTNQELPTSPSVVEVTRSPPPLNDSGESPSSRSSRLRGLAQRKAEDVLFSKALDAEAVRVTSAIASDAEEIDPIGDFLCVYDVFYFMRRLVCADPKAATLTVAQWIELKRNCAEDTISPPDDWKRFCEFSTLVRRCGVNLSQGLGHNQVVTGSTMNMSTSNLVSLEEAWKPTTKSAGGSSLSAVRELLARPWQESLPLTVATEKGITAVFAYTTLTQLMAHAAMNCSDRLLEPFFGMSIEIKDLSSSVERNLKSAPILDFTCATFEDAIEVMTSASLALLTDSTAGGRFVGLLRPEEVLEHISSRMDAAGNLVHVAHVSVREVWAAKSDLDTDSVHAADFPIVFASLLQKVLLARSGCLVILDGHDLPVGLISVRDIWEYVMQGAGPRS